jgi:transcriptional regulator with XRE-family HTH domain
MRSVAQQPPEITVSEGKGPSKLSPFAVLATPTATLHSLRLKMKFLGSKIREERKALGLTIDQFAELLGANRSMIQRVETGAKSPTIDLLIEIADVCRKPIIEFLGEEPAQFLKYSIETQRKIRGKDHEVIIIGPYGLISSNMVINLFRAETGTVVAPQTHKGHCWVYITRGACVFEHDGTSHELKAGDSIYYDASKNQTLTVESSLESVRITIRE